MQYCQVYPLQLGRPEHCEGSFLLNERQLVVLWSCLTFPNCTAGSTGSMWVKFRLLNEPTTTNSTIRESNQDLLDHRPIPNHCMLLPHITDSSEIITIIITGACKRTIHLSRVTSEPFEEPFLFLMGDWVRVDFTSSL